MLDHILPKIRESEVRIWSYWPINNVFLMHVNLLIKQNNDNRISFTLVLLNPVLS